MNEKQMVKTFYKCISVFIFFGLISCKTKPPQNENPIQPEKEEIVFIQVTDKAQISYVNLPGALFFADGSIYQFKTDINGKIVLKANPQLVINKIAYDFTNYKRVEGRLLAKEDFRFTKKVKTQPNTLIQKFELNLTANAGARTILILDIF